MIPRVSAQGRSFKGAGLYYLHDKEAMTAERVGYTETLNLPTNDPEKAMKVMAWVASHQRDIREAAVARQAEAAGVSYDQYVRDNNPFRGRPMERTVYAYSLSWHPSEKITPGQMASAAKETLGVLGLKDHQAVLVEHTDEPHPHMHVIVNKVNPESGLGPKRLNEKTGRQEDALKNDHIKLSLWAEGYERRTGRILCWNRVENNAKRFPADGSPGQYVKYKGEHASRPDYDWWQKNKDRDGDAIRSQRFADQAAERTTLQERETTARDKLERKLEKDYAPQLDKLKFQIAEAEKRLKQDGEKPRLADGFFSYVRSLARHTGRKLTGAASKDERLIRTLRKAETIIDKDKTARRERFDKAAANRWQKLKNKQTAERKRDDQRITLRDRERQKIQKRTKTKESFSENTKLASPPQPAKAQVKAAEKDAPKPKKRNRNRNRQRVRKRGRGNAPS